MKYKLSRSASDPDLDLEVKVPHIDSEKRCGFDRIRSDP
jgi:hypothetical protein